jgi:hypothetical protein
MTPFCRARILSIFVSFLQPHREMTRALRTRPIFFLSLFTFATSLPAQSTTSPLNFSGVLFANYRYELPTTPAPLPGQVDNSFLLDRAYLNFRVAAGERTSIRITTDIYQTTEATPNAYAIRAKFAYLQYELPKASNGAGFLGRIGLVNNPVVEHVETFWPRYLGQVAAERAGHFASADAGLAALFTLPSKRGEVYATILNGPGYTARERDRFKDFSIRLSLTPLASQTSVPLLQTFTLSLWGYKGATASSFVNGGPAQVGAIGQALDRSRAGVFLGLRDPRLTLGAEYAQRHEDGEQGANTLESPRTITGITGRYTSAFAVVRPLAFMNETGVSPFGFVGRYDHVKPSTSATGYVSPLAPPVGNGNHLLVAGIFYDLSQRAQMALDYQESLAADNGVSLAPTTQSKAYFAHFMISF